MVFDDTGSVWGDTVCNLVVLGQYNLVLIGIEWYWVNKGLLCLYILKKLMVTSTDRPTNRVNIEHTSYLSFFLHGQHFWRIKFTPKNANFSR